MAGIRFLPSRIYCVQVVCLVSQTFLRVGRLSGRGKSKLKKDPGIPNLHPLKEEMLRKAEAARLKAEALKDRQRAKRNDTVSKAAAGLAGLERLQAEAQARAAEFEQVQAEESIGAAAGIPDSSRRAFAKEFKQVTEAADVILEVLDARDPLGCRPHTHTRRT